MISKYLIVIAVLILIILIFAGVIFGIIWISRGFSGELPEIQGALKNGILPWSNYVQNNYEAYHPPKVRG